jgi:hypothetical protein
MAMLKCPWSIRPWEMVSKVLWIRNDFSVEACRKRLHRHMHLARETSAGRSALGARLALDDRGVCRFSQRLVTVPAGTGLLHEVTSFEYSGGTSLSVRSPLSITATESTWRVTLDRRVRHLADVIRRLAPEKFAIS